jgi:hypothetical protein
MVAAVFAVIGVVLTITFVRLSADVWSSADHLGMGATEALGYPAISSGWRPPVVA